MNSIGENLGLMKMKETRLIKGICMKIYPCLAFRFRKKTHVTLCFVYAVIIKQFKFD
jgi:hypothetical protein